VPTASAALPSKAQGDLNGAIADYTRAVEFRSEVHPNRLLQPRRRQWGKGDIDGAIADYTPRDGIQSEIYPCLLQPRRRQGGQGDIDGAIADYTRAIELDPKDAHA